MGKGENVKRYLIEVASRLFLEKGYSNTGINDILSEAKVSKGSFYFYFSSKKELGLEVARFYEKMMIKDWLEPLSGNAWDVFVSKVVLDIKRSAAFGNYLGCPLAVLGMEVSLLEEDLSKAYTYGIKELISIFSNSLQASGIAKDKADIIGRKALAIYEGHLLYYRITKDESTFDCMLNDLLEVDVR